MDCVFKYGKLLKTGYTTGACAAAAAKAAVLMAARGEQLLRVSIELPDGSTHEFEIVDAEIKGETASCAVVKRAGDDPDVTDGMRICAHAHQAPGITVEAGEGIGVVTREGLKVPVGSHAINPAPMGMIKASVKAAVDECGWLGAHVRISAPGGEKIALRTFNPRLGISGGISILGTTGIVTPMSDDALLATVELELSQRRAVGRRFVALVPGNYGLGFAKETLGITDAVMCSNFIGRALDRAAFEGFEGALLIGHAGKLVKLAGGIMDTHSRVADCRAALYTAHAALCGMDAEGLRALYGCATTDAMNGVLIGRGMLEPVWASLSGAIDDYIGRRTDMPAGAIVYAEGLGIIGRTRRADKLLKACKREGGLSCP